MANHVVTITVTDVSTGKTNVDLFDAKVDPWTIEVIVGDVIFWECKDPFLVEFEHPQHFEYQINYGASVNIPGQPNKKYDKESAKKKGPSGLASLGNPRGAKKPKFGGGTSVYQASAAVLDGDGLYKYSIRVIPAGNEVVYIDPGYRVRP